MHIDLYELPHIYELATNPLICKFCIAYRLSSIVEICKKNEKNIEEF